MHRFNTVPNKIPERFFTKTKISKMYMEPKKTLIAKSILAKYKNTGGIAILDYEIYCRAIIMKTIWYRHKTRYADQ